MWFFVGVFFMVVSLYECALRDVELRAVDSEPAASFPNQQPRLLRHWFALRSYSREKLVCRPRTDELTRRQ